MGPMVPAISNAGSNEPVEPAVPAFVPVTLNSPPSGDRDIHIQWQHGSATMNAAWPTSAARDCAVWLRELMR